MELIVGHEKKEIKSIYEEHEYFDGAVRPVLRIHAIEPLTKAQIQTLFDGPIMVEFGEEQRQYGQYDTIAGCIYTLTKRSDIEIELDAAMAELDTLRAENAALKKGGIVGGKTRDDYPGSY